MSFFVYGTEYNNSVWKMYHLGVDWILIHELTGEDVIDAFNRVCNYWGKINSLWYLEAYAAYMGL